MIRLLSADKIDSNEVNWTIKNIPQSIIDEAIEAITRRSGVNDPNQVYTIDMQQYNKDQMCYCKGPYTSASELPFIVPSYCNDDKSDRLREALTRMSESSVLNRYCDIECYKYDQEDRHDKHGSYKIKLTKNDIIKNGLEILGNPGDPIFTHNVRMYTQSTEVRLCYKSPLNPIEIYYLGKVLAKTLGSSGDIEVSSHIWGMLSRIGEFSSSLAQVKLEWGFLWIMFSDLQIPKKGYLQIYGEDYNTNKSLFIKYLKDQAKEKLGEI